ncbi:MAG: helix-turn-helix domain-containing protein, partial [Solirubrobacteraceae bacterium]|nr:helix-turn-helix domain-containing protein [Solirubrobacteraceae bacterium]
MARKKGADADDAPDHRVRVRLDEVLGARGMTLAELSRQVGVSQVNLSVLKNGHARAIRFS